MAQKTTQERVIAAHKRLRAKLGRAPSSTEILASIKEPKVSPARVRQIISDAKLHSYVYNVQPNKAPIDEPIKLGRSEIEQLVIGNIRRLYRLEMAKEEPRSDLQMARDGEFSQAADAAGVFRRYFNGGNNIGMLAVSRFARTFGVPVHELFLPTESDT